MVARDAYGMLPPRFAVAIGQRGGCHVISVSRVENRDHSTMEPVEMDGRAFCGFKSPGSYWTNWAGYAKVGDLCKKCLKSWVHACTIETDSEAKAELQNLLTDEDSE